MQTIEKTKNTKKFNTYSKQQPIIALKDRNNQQAKHKLVKITENFYSELYKANIESP